MIFILPKILYYKYFSMSKENDYLDIKENLKLEERERILDIL